MDDRLVVPKTLRTALQRSFHWGHPDWDESLRKSTDFWWPQIHRDVMLCVRGRKECTEAGENFKTITFQAQYGKLSSVENVNDESSIDFAGPFKIATSTIKYLIGSIGSETAGRRQNFYVNQPLLRLKSF